MAARQLYQLVEAIKAQCLPLVDDNVNMLIET